MIYAVGSNFHTNAMQNFGSKNKVVNKTAKVTKNVVTEIGKELKMNEFKQINMEQLQKDASKNEYTYLSPFVPTNVKPKTSK